MATISKERLAELLAKARVNRGITAVSALPPQTQMSVAIADLEGTQYKETHSELISSDLNTLSNNSDLIGVDKSTGKSISYNENQLRFVTLASSGQSSVLIGAAGTGKTTCMRGVMQGLIQSGIAGLLDHEGHKYLESKTPGIVIVSYTRRAVSNIRKAVSDDMKKNCLTIHALLEYEPVYYEVFDETSGEMKNTMRFEPTRNSYRPLPSTIKVCVIEEASMVSCELFKELSDALPANCQYILLGDIQQLPPVFGSAILGYKMLELPVVELTEVYRQALESPIIRLAHRILSGVPIPLTEYPEWKVPGQLTIHPWKKKLAADTALLTIAKFLTVAIEAGQYDPDNDMVLIPFNKSCGTIELNKHIAQHMARKRGAEVFEIVAGFNKLYLAPGDKILYDKEDAIVLKITENPAYTGAKPQPSGLMLDYWGYNSGDEHTQVNIESESTDDEIDFMLSQAAAVSGSEERVRQSSHEITVRILETETDIKITSVGDVANLLLSYALTVHKSQGSEFRKVFLMLHQSHATMLSRELLYTAVTRAKEELYIICEPESMKNGILSQRIKGNTLAEKAEFFKGKISGEKLS